ncbi:MAG: hypothetical protein JW889_00735 [Verrucomicrobia bacterium]|nr:hypothetical protein [Verrucomicrobiota bacterium]
MRRSAPFITLISIACLVAGCGCTKATQREKPRDRTTAPAEGTTLALLPASNEPKGWILTSPPNRYVGRELYERIDGAADAFFQFEFKEAAFGMYRRGKSLIQLAVYKMGSPDDACGIASLHNDVNAEHLVIAREVDATLHGDYLYLAKGPYFVVSQHAMYGEAFDVRTGMVELAEAVAARIEAPRSTPAILGLLPEGAVAGSVRYFRTPMTQGNLFYITYENVLGLRAETFGVAAHYDTVITEAGTHVGRNALFAITYPTPDDAPRIFREAGTLLAQEPFQVAGMSAGPDALLSVSQDGKPILMLGCTDGVLYGAWDIEDEARVDALLADLVTRLRRAAQREDTL